MRLRKALLLVVVSILCTAQAGAPRAADPDCLSKLGETAKRARAHINVYLNALKGMSDNPWARNSASVCSSAFSRAEQYYKKQTANSALCTGASSYVDNQITQLYKTASSTCLSEFDSVISKLPPDEQREVSDRVAKEEGRLR